MADFETHPAGTAERIAELETALTRANAANDIWSKNSRETFEAMVAMRDSINEFVPMPSLESDLLQGPENSVFCATVADAVVSALTRANAATAAAYEVAESDMVIAAAWAHYGSLSAAKSAIRALATSDQTAALDKLIAEAVGPLVDALDAVLAWHDKDKHTAGKMTFERSSVFAKARAASKKGNAA